MLAHLDKICPSFITYYLRLCSVYLFKKFARKQKSYDGIDELEEEEFSITSLPHDTIRSPETPSNQHISTQDPFDHSLPKDQQEQTLVEKQDDEQFKLNLEPFDEYYDLIASKTSNISQLFNQLKTEVELDLGANRPNFKVYESPASNGFKFILTYQLPCSYAFYHSTNSQTKTVSQFSRNIENFELLETIKPNLSRFQISFKKIIGLGLEPRFFNYLKYVNNSTESSHWEIAISLSAKQAARNGSNPAPKEADIFSVSRIKEGVEEGRSVIWVKTYLEVDMRSVIRAPKIVAKGLKQIGYYLESLYQHAEDHYQQQVA